MWVVGAVAGLVLAGAPVAAAAPTWLAPVDLSAAEESSSGAQVLMDMNGRSVAVWKGPGDAIQLGLRSPGATFGAPADLTVAGGDVAAPQVSADFLDDVVVWERNNGANDIVQTARLQYEGDIEPTVDLSATGHDAHHPQVSASTDVGVVWERSDGTNTIVQAATQDRDDDFALSAFSAPVDLSAAGQDALDPHIATTYGAMIAVWRRYDGTNWRIQASTRPSGGSFSAPADLSAAGGDAMSARVVMDDSHGAVVVWRRFDGTHWIAQAAALPTADPIAAPTSFFSPVDVSADNVDALDPDLAIDAGGDTTIVWRAVDGADNIVQAVERFGDGTFSATTDLSAAESNAFAPKVSADQGVAVVWQALEGSDNVVRAVQRSTGESFSAPVDVSAPGDDAVEPRVASYYDDATAVWQRNGSDQVIQAAGLDVDGPVFQFAFFATLSSGVGTVGVPVSFVRPVAMDTWSAFGQSTWYFGDGTSATSSGPLISHTYTRTGTFNVTVDIYDVLGHVGSRTAEDYVTINSAPPPPPPLPPPPAAPVLALTHLRLAPASFRTAPTGSSTTRAAARRSGTRVRYDLSAAASVRFGVQRAVSGRRAGAGCAKRTNANRRRKTCTRYLPLAGAFTRERAAGADAFTFTGRIAAHRLRPGRYRLVAKATAGPRRDSTAAGFRVLR
jgi:hypothetical protein